MPLSAQQIEQLKSRLWSDEHQTVYALLDGAGSPGLLDRLYGNDAPAFECLYMGELAPDIAEVAPYLAHIEPGSAFADWVISGWGEHWSIFAVVPAGLELPALRRHFRKLNIVYGPDSQPLMFRYYDPRVLAGFLPTCSNTQLGNVFGPVISFVFKSDDNLTARILSAANSALVQELLSLE